MLWAALLAICACAAAQGNRNVLVIIVDDLRPEFGSYNASWMKTPNIDALAARGTRFARATANYAVCNPSRNSFFSGRVPDNTMVWSFHHDFREAMPKQPTIASLLKQANYTTTFGGKITHPSYPRVWDWPKSWTTDTGRDPFWYFNRGMCGNDTSDPYCEIDCPMGYSLCEIPDLETVYDRKLADWAVDNLKHYSETNEKFAMFVGFRRPHNNWRVPYDIFNEYPDDVPIATVQEYPQNAPPIGFFQGGFHFPGGPASNNFTTPVPDWAQRLARHGYWASVTQTDQQIGRVLTQLKASGLEDDTMVFLWADHGWSLGEANQWHKHSNRVFPARVPLIVSVPWIPESTKGALVEHTHVELIDQLPTIFDTAVGHPPVKEDHDGISYRNILEDPTNTSLVHRNMGFWQYARCPQVPGKLWHENSCTPHGRGQIVAMGYSVMTQEWRYTAWMAWDNTTLAAKEGEWDTPTYGDELYDHRNDTLLWWDSPQMAEAHDVSDEPENAQVVANLKALLKNNFYRSPEELQARNYAFMQNSLYRQPDPVNYPPEDGSGRPGFPFPAADIFSD